MSTTSKPRKGTDFALAGGGLLMVLCCAIGPAVIGAVAGSALGTMALTAYGVVAAFQPSNGFGRVLAA